MIHPTAIIYPGTIIGEDVKIGPYTVVGGDPLTCSFNKKLGYRVRRPARYPPIIKDHVDIGPFCSIQLGTERRTTIGYGTFLGAYVNIGHDCDIGKHNIIVNGSKLAGFVETGENVKLWMNVTVKQRVKIGAGAEVGMSSSVYNDILPGSYGYGNPFQLQERPR